MNEILQQRIEEKSKELGQMFFPDNMNVFARPNWEAGYIETACKEIAKYALQNQWISAEEDLPPYDKAVIGMDYMPELAWDDQTIIFVHRSNNPEVVTDKNKFCVYPPSFCKVTHWMEIPQLEGGEK